MLVLGAGADEAALAGARGFAEKGKTVLVPMISAEMTPMIRKLLEAPDFTATEAPARDYAMLARIDFQHPLFAPFADPRFSDFTKIHFWKHRRFDAAALPQARVLAHFDDRDPAVVEVPLGEGRRDSSREQLAAQRQPARAFFQVRAAALYAARAEQPVAAAKGAISRRRARTVAPGGPAFHREKARWDGSLRARGQQLWRHRSIQGIIW